MPFKRLETVFSSANKDGQRPERSYQKPQKITCLTEAREDTCSWSAHTGTAGSLQNSHF